MTVRQRESGSVTADTQERCLPDLRGTDILPRRCRLLGCMRVPGRGKVAVRHPVLLGLTIVLAPVLWAAFVATKQMHEVVVGAAVSVASVLFTVFVCRSSDTELTLRGRDLAQAWRIPWYIVSGVGDIVMVLCKDVLGIERAQNLYRVCGFDSSGHDPVRMARSILATAYTTTAPNFIVIGVDASQSRMLFHQISPSTVPIMTKALGAKA